MKNLSTYTLIIGFIAILILPTVNDYLRLFEFEELKENRNIMSKPKFDINHLDPLPRLYNEYYNDHFSFRAPLIQLNNKINVDLFGISPTIEKTVFGEGEWMFRSGEEKRIFEGNEDFSSADLEKFYNEWKRRDAYFKNRNIEYAWLIAPIKHYIYNDKLGPDFVQSREEKRVTTIQRLLDEIKPGLVIDPTDALRAMKDSLKIYYKFDNHWNSSGAHIAANEVLKQFSMPIIKRNDCVWKGDSMSDMSHCTAIGRPDIREFSYNGHKKKGGIKKMPKIGFKPLHNPETTAFDHEYRFISKTTKNEKKLLVITDSFGDLLKSYLNSEFKETVWIFDSWRYQLNEHIIEQYQPDVVLFVSYESHIDNLIRDYGQE